MKKSLQRQDAKPRASRENEDFIHVSSLAAFCARAYALGEGQSNVDAPATGGHQVLWVTGNAIEKMVVENVVADRNRFGILARWTCVCGHRHFEGLYAPSLGNCVKCGQGLTNHRHYTFYDRTAKIVGSPDLTMYVDRQLLIVEVKSMNGKDWDVLKAPMPDHLFQAFAYRKLAMVNGFTVHPNVAFLYVRKDFKWGDPYHEFHVRHYDQMEALLAMSWTDASRLVSIRESKTLPLRINVCRKIDAPRPKSCPVSLECFARRQ